MNPLLHFLSLWGKELLLVMYGLTIIMSVVVVILDKRNPSKALMWTLVLVLLPGTGLLLYLFLGRNLRRRPYGRKQLVLDLRDAPSGASPYVMPELPPGHRHTQFPSEEVRLHWHIVKLLLYSNSSPVLRGNATELFQEGPAAFDSLLKDLAGAREFIDMQFYIFRDDRIGGRIARVLRAKARAGVRVRLIYDDVGSWQLSRGFKRALQEAGVDARPFHRVALPWLATRLNYRNHRKIVVIDGLHCHMGGMNVADKYLTGDPRLGEWHDTQMRITGPAVAALHGVFLQDWHFVVGSEFPEFPKIVNYPSGYPGDRCIQIAASGPDSDWASIMQAFFMAISRAKRYIYICTPYFVPNESIETALRVAALSGVDVRLLLPGKSDSPMVLWATQSYIHHLLEAGIRVYLFAGGFNHSKVMMVDGEFSTIGSANMDIRSFESNFEVVSFVYSREVTQELELKFMADCMRSQSLTLEQWRANPLWKRMRNAVARLFSPLF